MRTSLVIAAWLLGVLPVLAQPAVPAASADERWTPWLGCWQQLAETVRGGGDADAEPRDVPTKGVLVCVTPAAGSVGVTMTTIVEAQSALEETIVADGSRRAIDEGGCSGFQTARWSSSGRRLFANAEMTCGDGGKRTIAGLTTLAPGPTWVEIQVVKAGERESIRVRRYRRSPNQAQARLSADRLAIASAAAARQAVSFNLEEVKEAAAAAPPSLVEAALVETRASFPLNAKRLQDLDAAGVPDRVLDLMIALSFPDRFVIERRVPAPRVATSGFGGGFDSFGWYDLSYDLFPYYYAPFMYSRWGSPDFLYYGPAAYGVAVVTPEIQPSGQGRVVDGQGYTRVRARVPEPTGVAGGSGYGDGVGGGAATGSGGGVTSQGYSGGGGGDSGRTAVARPPGE